MANASPLPPAKKQLNETTSRYRKFQLFARFPETMIRVVASTEHVAVPTEKFLREVQKRPCLWDPTHTMFPNLNARKLAFRLIAGKLIPDATGSRKDEIGILLSKKWKGIRDHYVNVIRSDSCKLDKYSSNRYIQLLGFLDSTLPPSSLEKVRVRESNSHVTSSSTQAGNSQTCQSLVSTDERASDSGCASPKGRRSPPKRKDTAQSQSTVMIDGVEFEQVTLANGEVIVKLKEEVLEGCPPPRRIVPNKKGNSAISVKKDLQPERNNDKRHDRNEQNGGQAQQQSNQRQVVSEQEQRQTTFNELKITGTTTLASDKKFKIIGTSTLDSNVSQGTIRRIDENRSPNVVSTPETGDLTIDKKLFAIKSQTISNTPKLVFQKFSDVLNAKNPVSINRKETVSRKTDSVDVSGTDKNVNLAPQDGTGGSNIPGNLQTTSDFLDRWNAELKRLSDLPRKHFQKHSSVGSGQNRNLGVIAVSNDSRSSDGQNSSNNQTRFKKVRTNRNTEVLKVPSVHPPSADDRNLSPNLTPTKKVRTNRNTVVWATDLSDCDAEGSRTPSSLTPAKKLKTNRNVMLRSSDSSPEDSSHRSRLIPEKPGTNRTSTAKTGGGSGSSSDDQETLAPAPVKVVTANQNTISEVEPQSSKTVEIPDDDDLPSKDSETIDSPDEDEDKMFLLSLLPEMKTMTEAENYEFRLEIMQALTRAKYS